MPNQSQPVRDRHSRRLPVLAVYALLCLLFMVSEASAWILYTPVHEGDRFLSFEIPSDMKLAHEPISNDERWIAAVQDSRGYGVRITLNYTQLSDMAVQNVFDYLLQQDQCYELFRDRLNDGSPVSFSETGWGAMKSIHGIQIRNMGMTSIVEYLYPKTSNAFDVPEKFVNIPVSIGGRRK